MTLWQDAFLIDFDRESMKLLLLVFIDGTLSWAIATNYVNCDAITLNSNRCYLRVDQKANTF